MQVARQLSGENECRSPRRLLLSAILLAVAFTAGVGCLSSGAKSPGGDPERMSESEYDIAADLWLRQNQPRGALEHALKAVELNEDNHLATHLVALIYLGFCGRSPAECRLAEAERYARLAVQGAPEFRDAKNTLAVILIHQKRYAEAIDLLRPLAADMLYQTPENAWGNLGWAYLETGQLERAIDALRRSVAAQPMFCVGSYRLGLAYERNGEPAPALEALNQGLAHKPAACQQIGQRYAEKHTDDRGDTCRP